MKCLKTPSLFFLFLFCVKSGNLIAQQTIDRDSIAYWSELISSPKGEEDLIGSYLFFDQARELSTEQNDTTGTIYNLSMLSVVEFELGAYNESENSAISALKLVDEKKIDEWSLGVIISLYNSLGKAHKELNDYENAIESYDNVLRLSNNLDDCIKAYNNKANVYINEARLQQALTELSYANDLTYLNKDKKENARVLANLGFVQSKLENPNGIVNMLQALTIRTNENDLTGMFSSSKQLSEYYRFRNLDSALIYSNKVLELSKKINTPTYKKEALSNLLKFEENPYYSAYLDIETSLREKELARDVKFSHAKYDIQKERQKALTQKLQAEAKNKRQKLLFVGGGIILLIIGIFLYLYLRSKHKKEKVKVAIRETYQTERRLSKKVHDELANDMSDILNFIGRQAEIPNSVKKPLENKMDNIYDRTRDISAEIGSFDTTNFTESLNFLIMQHRTKGVKVLTNVNAGINWDDLPNYKKTNVYRCIQELFVNMKKHSESTEVRIMFKRERNKYQIQYTDNGKGVVLDNLRKSGLNNMETRMHDIGGSITFNSSINQGFRAYLYFTN
ncbi:hypothetical protein GCM10011344_13340 [Dokdonia pacifica]|uniref:histidine kinase n=1 Tax=Dokdonia pacifica TaxID=1627892 RepID=A0A238W8T6_9FLAO|nr:hypothetical protein [Dokdonia pacifica]GGG14029.1 hypothetical protein GCM10011344_13340 [Dokdonia pacifica]SNR42986.1 Tetratricopeptide repeat-containing protein [Dokdonia pacifica]